MQRQRVLVVGAGKRAQETIIPALMSLGDSAEIAGVLARSARKLKLYGGDFTVQTETLPEALDISRVDTIAVAVTRSEVPAVLRSLARFDTSHVTLMLDTPVLDPGDFGATRAFRRFRRVVCSEDSIALPPVTAARSLIEQGTIGRTRAIYLVHSGWRNHALASVRWMLGMRRPTRIAVRRWNPKWSETRLRFPGGVRASVVQPHIHGHGRLLVVGDRGAIADYETDRSDVTQIGYRVTDGVYRGLTINGEPVASEHDRLFFENLPRGLPDPTLDNMFKIRGFMELVTAVHGEEPSLAYDPYEAIYDHQSLRLAERIAVLVDPRLGRKRSILSTGIQAATAASRAVRRR
jgi:predicted dehydrogenase